MTPLALGALPSSSPLPAGKPARHPCASGGQIAMPASGNFMVLNPGSGGSGYQSWWQGQLGPYNLPYRYWLKCGANWIQYNGVSWQRYDVAIYLLIGGSAYGNDLNGQTYHQNADSAESTATWMGQSIEAHFFCEANTTYHVRFLSQAQGANANYYQHPVHMNMWSYTVGEGVY
jgi:hypothetical protein